MKRVVVVGLDGATFTMMDRFLAAGELPAIRRFIKEGNRNILRSTVPPATIPAWPSFYTGKNPGKHGVFDFIREDSMGRRVVTRNDVKALAIWEILSLRGLDSVVINVPATYPPRRIKGVIASGMLTRSGGSYVEPSPYRAIFDRIAGGYRISEDHSLHVHMAKIDEDAFTADVLDVAGKQWKVFKALLATHEWRFAMMMFRATDVVQHHLWRRPERVLQVYRALDGYLGEILESYPRALKIIMSDHGFSEERWVFSINAWLESQGYLKIRPAPGSAGSGRGAMSGIVGHDAEGGSSGHDGDARSGRLARVIPAPLQRWIGNNLPRAAERFFGGMAWEMDPSETRAHALQFYTTEVKAVYINLCGREPRGIVDPSEYESLRDELIGKLADVKASGSDRPIVREIYRREEIYHGPHTRRAPDILYVTQDEFNVDNTLRSDRLVKGRWHVRGRHSPDGVFLVHGDEVDRSANFRQAFSIMDLAPTILHYLGLPIDSGMDGRVLDEVFSPGSETRERKKAYEDYELQDCIRRLRAKTEGPLP